MTEQPVISTSRLEAFSDGVIFFMNALAFTLLRRYVIDAELIHQTISKAAQRRAKRKNRLALLLYLSNALFSPVSVYISFAIFCIVPAMYFMPEKIVHEAQAIKSINQSSIQNQK